MQIQLQIIVTLSSFCHIIQEYLAITKLVPCKIVTLTRMSHYPGSHYQKSIVSTRWGKWSRNWVCLTWIWNNPTSCRGPPVTRSPHIYVNIVNQTHVCDHLPHPVQSRNLASTCLTCLHACFLLAMERADRKVTRPPTRVMTLQRTTVVFSATKYWGTIQITEFNTL